MKRLIIFSFTFFLFFIVVNLYCREFHPEVFIEDFHLKDGSIIKGVIVKKITKSDSIVIKNKYLGEISINREFLKFMGKNQNNGVMFSLSPIFNSDEDHSFKKGIMYNFSSNHIFDEKFSTSFDFSYFYRKFTKNTEKYIKISGNDKIEGLVSGNFKYKAHFIMPVIIMRMNLLPESVQSYLSNKNLYPYIGIGVGYGLSLIKYKLDADSLEIQGEMYSENDISYKNYYYHGLIWKALFGLSFKISSRITIVSELSYHDVTFEQLLYDYEKEASINKEKFKI